MWRMLYDAGVFVNVFISPGVPPGKTNDENFIYGNSSRKNILML
jgi:hypothetical protein